LTRGDDNDDDDDEDDDVVSSLGIIFVSAEAVFGG